MYKPIETDLAIIGGGLAGLCCAYEVLNSGKKVLILDRDAAENLGGLARKSFGGVMLVDTPQQRKLGIKDSPKLAWHDWQSYAEFESDNTQGQAWAKLYCQESIPEIYEFLSGAGISFLSVVNWPERGYHRKGNSVPRWHITWGTGYELAVKVIGKLKNHPKAKNLTILHRHNVSDYVLQSGVVKGCSGIDEEHQREFSVRCQTLVAAHGGYCGGDLSFLRQHWNPDLLDPPKRMLNGAHSFGDGRLHLRGQEAGAQLKNLHLQWHYAGGVHHPNPTRPNDGISLVPPRSALWLDAMGQRFSPPLIPYTDTRHLVERITHSGYDYSWLLMNTKIAEKELAVSGSEFMTAFRNKSSIRLLLNLIFGNTALVERLKNDCVDVVFSNSLDELILRMQALESNVQADHVKESIADYDAAIARGPRYLNDEQLRWILNFRSYRGDRIRTCNFQPINDKKAAPFIAIRTFLLARKSLGGLLTDLNSQVLNSEGQAIPGFFAVGEAAGFGGGGIHGKRSLEGTFLGSCVLTGRRCGRFLATGNSNLS